MVIKIFNCNFNVSFQLSTRVRNAVEQKKRWVSAMSAGVCPEGQKLYMTISKTIDQVCSHSIPLEKYPTPNSPLILWSHPLYPFYFQITWKGQNIVVFNDVTIKPPYKVENVGGNPESRQLTYVKKIVEKFVSDQAATSSADSSPPPGLTPTLTGPAATAGTVPSTTATASNVTAN